jgi:hypothetical protein
MSRVHSYFRDKDGEARFYWHVANLSDRDDSGPHRPRWRDGRGWLHIRCGDTSHAFGAEWHLGSNTVCHAYVRVNSPFNDDDATISVAIPGAAIWLHVENILPRWLTRRAGKCGVEVHHSGIWLSLWVDEMGWDRRWPWWKKTQSWYPLDTLFGAWQYRAQQLDSCQLRLVLPEGHYRVTAVMYAEQWKRTRWPFVKRSVRADLTPDRPIPIPGKGENSWDQEEDAIFEMTTRAPTPLRALAHLRENVLRRRERYGGKDWQPEAVPV